MSVHLLGEHRVCLCCEFSFLLFLRSCTAELCDNMSDALITLSDVESALAVLSSPSAGGLLGLRRTPTVKVADTNGDQKFPTNRFLKRLLL